MRFKINKRVHIHSLCSSKNRRAQEEMVGFALIVIIVSIILLVFLGFYLSKPSGQAVKSYEAESFVQSMLQTSSQCQDYFGYVSVKNLIFMCSRGDTCNNGSDSCQILNSTLSGILSNGWNIAKGGAIKGYSLNITSSTGYSLELQSENVTSNSEGSSQDFPDSNGNEISIIFNGYY